MLVLLTGLPCTGKSTVADAISRSLGACVLSADAIDAALSTAGIPNEEGKVGYELMRALARNDLAAGRPVVIDAVNPFRWVRQAYFELARESHAQVSVIVTLCTDAKVHRRRVASRHEHGKKSIDWPGVERQIGYYEGFDGECLVLDAADPADENCSSAVEYVLGRAN